MLLHVYLITNVIHKIERQNASVPKLITNRAMLISHITYITSLRNDNIRTTVSFKSFS